MPMDLIATNSEYELLPSPHRCLLHALPNMYCRVSAFDISACKLNSGPWMLKPRIWRMNHFQAGTDGSHKLALDCYNDNHSYTFMLFHYQMLSFYDLVKK